MSAEHHSGSQFVFVYGTLKAGHRNHRLLDHADQIAVNVRLEGFLMFDVAGAFPAVVRGSSTIIGEVYRIDDETLADLDYLESNGRLYCRELVDVAGVKAWIYLYNRPVRDKDLTIIPEGEWK